MSNPIAIEKSRQGKRRAIERLFERYPINEEFMASDGDLADQLRVPKQDMQNARYDLVTIGSAKTQKKSDGRRGFKMVWTLTEPKGVTLARLEAKWRKDDEITTEKLRGPNPKKAAASRRRFHPELEGATPEHPVLPDQLVASSGPEPTPVLKPVLAPERHDEPAALIEAARQYASTNAQLEAKVRELEALGVSVDRAALAKAIKAPHDHRLLIVSQVLPYIDRLERENARHVDTIADLRGKLADMPSLRDGNRRLSDQNQRLVAQITTLRNERANGRTAEEPAPKAAAPAANG